MPKIPVYTAQGGAPQPTSRSRIEGPPLLELPASLPTYKAIAGTGSDVAETSIAIGKILGHLQAQKDESDYLTLRGQFEGALKKADVELPHDPEVLADPKAYYNKY